MKVIFLDFDGVLNSIRSATAFGGYPWNVEAESLKRFDMVAVALIRNLCKEHNITIVLSSTWRKQFTPEFLGEALKLPIIDKTAIKFSGKSRGSEIQEWLDTHPEVTEYAILDDDSDMLETQKGNFVQTCPYEGFSYANYLKLKRVLKIEEEK